MTTVVQPEVHGPEVVHANGLCPVLACRDAHNARQRHRRRMKAYQRWEPFVDAEPVRQHVRALLDDPQQDWSIIKISEASGVPKATVTALLYDRGAQLRSKRVRTDNAQALLAVRPSLDSYGHFVCVEPTGTHRRVQALCANGWSLSAIGRAAGIGTSNGQKVLGYTYVHASTARVIRDTYNRLWDQVPEQHGVLPEMAKRTRAWASKQGWAKPQYWDDDTIDDPNGFPDWTGHCGTVYGWMLHLAAGGPSCPACAAAEPTAAVKASPLGVLRTCAEGLDLLRAEGRTWAEVADLLNLNHSSLVNTITDFRKQTGEAA